VVSARYLLTRDGRSFASAVLEDFSGQVEVMVWPKVYADTDELWKEGNELIIQGKVRVRDEQAQLSCDSVRLYAPPQEEKEPAAKPAARPVARAPEVPAEKVVQGPVERHRLLINIQQTKDADGDIARLNKIMAILKTYAGRDEVRLNVVNGGAAIPMKLPNIQTGYCLELKQRLIELVGEAGLKVEKL
jgi:DNA polymerase-3 subunit alpha